MTFLSCGFIEENIGNDEQSNGGTGQEKEKIAESNAYRI